MRNHRGSPQKLIIGNKNYSSWSLRAWLMLAAFEVSFEELKVNLSTAETAATIGRYSSAGKVPVLHDGELVVWDSLAICEYVSEKYLNGRGWPEDMEGRVMARSCSTEMHSGLFTLREAMPMNCRATNRRVERSPQLEKEIARVITL